MADEKTAKRPDWMTSISVNAEDYMLGRKVDKTFELSQKEKADRAREARIELIASNRIKLSHDPILDLERRRHELKMELIRNPVKLRQFRERLLQLDRDEQGSPNEQPATAGQSNSNEEPRATTESPNRSHPQRDGATSSRVGSEHSPDSDIKYRRDHDYLRRENRGRHDHDDRHRGGSKTDRHREYSRSSKTENDRHGVDGRDRHGSRSHGDRHRSSNDSRSKHRSRSPRSRRSSKERHRR